MLTRDKVSINMRFVSATETVTVRESRETGMRSEGVDHPAEGWVVSRIDDGIAGGIRLCIKNRYHIDGLKIIIVNFYLYFVLLI